MIHYLHTCPEPGCGRETSVTVTPAKPGRRAHGEMVLAPDPASAWPETCPGCGAEIDATAAIAAAESGQVQRAGNLSIAAEDGPDCAGPASAPAPGSAGDPA